MSIPPNRTRRLFFLAAGAVALAVALAAPEVKHALTPPEQRSPSGWSLEDIQRHLARRGPELELRPVRNDVASQAHLARPGTPDTTDEGRVLLARSPNAEEAARSAALPPGRSAAWGPWLLTGDPELVAQIKSRLPGE